MDNKALDKCLLAEDAKSPSAYYSINRKKKRSDKYCPRCNAKAVNRDMRKCMACGGRLHWQGDSCAESNAEMSWWFMWMKNTYGVEGWYNKDYWVGNFA